MAHLYNEHYKSKTTKWINKRLNAKSLPKCNISKKPQLKIYSILRKRNFGKVKKEGRLSKRDFKKLRI